MWLRSPEWQKLRRRAALRYVVILGFVFLSVFFISSRAQAHAQYYWDFPRYVETNTGETTKSDVKPIHVEESIMVFYLAESSSEARIRYITTQDMKRFSNPKSAVGEIRLKKGFSPHFDAFYAHGVVFVVWNTMDGSLHMRKSTDDAITWEEEEVLVSDENFCFRPRAFLVNKSLYLFYHIESEGRRIDFFFIQSRDMGKTWTAPKQVAKGFAGSFFPVLGSSGEELKIVWQSRPFTEEQTPIFNIYLSTSSDNGKSWSVPLKLIEDAKGENKRPDLLMHEEGFTLFYEGDRGGATGVYMACYDRFHRRIGDEIKVNVPPSNTRNPQVFIKGEGLVVFYIDSRDGNDRLYYAWTGDAFREKRFQKSGTWEEGGPIGGSGKDILHYSPVEKDGSLYVFWVDSRGIAFVGPDASVPPIRLLPLKSRYIGRSGTVVRWKELVDSSGLEGYAYSFNREEQDEPEIINLSPGSVQINLSTGYEGPVYFHLRAKDAAGNFSDTVTVSFTADLTPPHAARIVPLELDSEDFHADNSPLFRWERMGQDVAGYNYSLTRKKMTLAQPRVRTTGDRARYRSVDEGTWYFNVAAVDRAGNVGPTSHFRFKLNPVPQGHDDQKPVKLAPPWILSRETFEVNPVLNISLYVVLGGLLFITFFVTVDIILKKFSVQGGEPMEGNTNETGIRKKRFGLRFKFSFLIVALILILTIGISGVLSYVSTENQKRALADQMMDKARLSLENMTNVAREGILNNDELLLLSVISKTMENKDIHYSIILDTENRVIAHSDINERGQVHESELLQRAVKERTTIIDPPYSPDELAQLYVLVEPVVFSDTVLGTVEIGYSTESIFRTIEAARKENLFSALVVTAVTICVGILGAILMAAITIKPIKVLAKGANIIGQGRLDYKIHIKARDEIGLLSDEFNRMTGRLLDYQKKMEEKAKLDEQLEIARSIQQELIPQQGIENARVSINGFYKAAVGVGGDYYDFLEIDGDKYGVIMSDVAGKGVPASLMMIMIRTIFKSLVNSGVSEPARVVTLMNETLSSDISSDRFATLLFGVFEGGTRHFHYTNAGYGPLLVYKHDRKRCFLVNQPAGSVPIGVMPDAQYKEENPIAMVPGDSIVLFTDGVHEARNEKEEEYGMKRLAEIIPGFAGKDSKEIANLIIDDVTKFVGSAEQYDDMTLTVMKIK
jgi:serine phosphatase RsbU (regulator of sigma subunit)